TAPSPSPDTAPASAPPTPAPPSPPSGDNNHVTIYHPDGQPIGYLHLNPDKNYIPLTPTPTIHNP
ncbi:hypothetical protein ACPXCJ_10135, partial [Micromonospora chalcea]|uniref:hypothetical protein n=1 Tax=Micromonospora chalcea TaxID=1874 RepID=UPI003CF4B326